MTPPDCPPNRKKGFFSAPDYAPNTGLIKACFLSLVVAVAGACNSPAVRFSDTAERLGFRLGSARSSNFDHLLVHNERSGNQLHLYFGGDGSPWIQGRWLSSDPTPKRAVTLELMALDTQPAVYVGRPCYHAQTGPCTPALITNARYSETIVASMEEVVRHLIAQRPTLRPVLFGFSGGGVLALLVAERIAAVDEVVTVAANLDIDAWAEHHGYLSLDRSINPAEHYHWRTDLSQLHLRGAQDQNVPPATLERFRVSAPNARVRTFERFDHGCCWQRAWPAILEALTDP